VIGTPRMTSYAGNGSHAASYYAASANAAPERAKLTVIIK